MCFCGEVLLSYCPNLQFIGITLIFLLILVKILVFDPPGRPTIWLHPPDLPAIFNECYCALYKISVVAFYDAK